MSNESTAPERTKQQIEAEFNEELRLFGLSQAKAITHQNQLNLANQASQKHFQKISELEQEGIKKSLETAKSSQFCEVPQPEIPEMIEATPKN